MHPGQRIRLRIEGVTAAGDGVGRAEGRAVFVPRVLPGEVVEARVVHVGARQVAAEAGRVVAPSPDRVEPPCPVYGRCGGCQLMHASYPAQLRLKRIILEDSLRTIAGVGLDAPVPIQPAPAPLGYRNRGQYPAGRRGKRMITGFFEPRSHRVVPVQSCRIHDPRVDRAVACVRAWARRKGISVYDEKRHRGFLRHVVGRVGARGQLLALVATRDQGSGYGDLIRRLRRQVAGITGVVLNVNPARTNVILGRRNRTLWGQGYVEEELSGLRFRLSLGSFFQVNTVQAAALFAKVSACVGPAAGPIVDAYCGVGVLGQLLARQGREVIGIEVEPRAVADARSAAQANRVTGLTIEEGRVERVLPGLVRRGLRPGAVVLDPPRKGCAPEVLEAVAESGTERIAYVSCHPGTLARDLKRLAGSGYRLGSIQAVDMFPQTAHLEVLAELHRT